MKAIALDPNFTFSTVLTNANISAKEFARLTGWDYRSVVNWCKNGVPEQMISTVLDCVFYIGAYGACPPEKLYHRAKKSGKALRPEMHKNSVGRCKNNADKNNPDFEKKLKIAFDHRTENRIQFGC